MAELPEELLRRLGAIEPTLRNASNKFVPKTCERQALLDDIDPGWQTREQVFFVRLLIEQNIGAIESFLFLKPDDWQSTEQEAVSQVLIQLDDHVLLKRFLVRGIISPSNYMLRIAANVGDRTFAVILEHLPKYNPAPLAEISRVLAARQRTDLLKQWMRAIEGVHHRRAILCSVLQVFSADNQEILKITYESYCEFLQLANIEKGIWEVHALQLAEIAYENDSPLFYDAFARTAGRHVAIRTLDSVLMNAVKTEDKALTKISKIEHILYWYPEVKDAFANARVKLEAEKQERG